MQRNSLRTQIWKTSISFVSAIGAALMVGIGILLSQGFQLSEILQSIYSGTIARDYRIASTISQTTMLALIGLACAIPFRAGMWNVGGEGQITIGAFVAAYIGFSINGLPFYIHLPLAVLGAMLGGLLWALIPALLKVRFRANEILTTIMMNYVALYLTDYFANYPFRAPNSPSAETPRILETAKMDTLVSLSTLNSGIFLVIPLILLVYFMIHRSRLGYEWEVIGINPHFARYGGLRIARMQVLSMMIGGALAGLLGSILVLGIQRRFIVGISGGLGFTGALMALIAFNSVPIVLLIAFIFAFIQSGMVGLQARLGVPIELSDILQSLMILLINTRQAIMKIFISRWDGIFSKQREQT